MKRIDYTKYSLVLVHSDKIIFSSSKSGLRPLIECIEYCKQHKPGSDCTLYDKVIGLAAARLIVHSGLISLVNTPVMSKEAKKLLAENGIKASAEKIVERILNNERTGVCPMEQRAEKTTDNKAFYESLLTIFSF